ncbi:MAG: hypothetical protein IJR94_02740 [Synergistaceae bacterium]|nr:hypothetical protein [Synergistaceae bacterium]
MLLPFWNSELYVEISSWFPFGKDYQPVSVNRFYGETLKNIASLSLDLESEFFFMASPDVGCVGNLPRENFFRYGADNIFHLGFLMVLGYSEKMEKAVTFSLLLSDTQAKEKKETARLYAGIASCSLGREGILQSTSRVIAIASDEPFYDCDSYLKILEFALVQSKNILKAEPLAYYAEKFGYKRFFMPWENENPYALAMSKTLSELEESSSKDIVGGSATLDFPPFLGMTVQLG